MLLAVRSRLAALGVEGRCLHEGATRAAVAVNVHHTVVRMLFAVRHCHGSRDIEARLLQEEVI